MLPFHVGDDASVSPSASVTEYCRRMMRYTQMDTEYTFAQMKDLCMAPRKVYQLTAYRKQTKNQWARDDPAFIMVIVFFLFVASVAYAVAFKAPGQSVRIATWFVGVHFIATGLLLASAGWWLANTYLRVKSPHCVEQTMEWMYAFDIHCNAFFPLFLVLYVLHYFMLPFLVKTSFVAAITSNVLYAVAWCYYFYITSLGYAELRFLERAEVFLYPAGPLCIAAFVLSIMGVNLTRASLAMMGL